MCIIFTGLNTNKMATISKGTKVTFTPTGKTFVIANVTETRLSWYNEDSHLVNINTLKMSWITLNAFNKAIEKGIYVIN